MTHAADIRTVYFVGQASRRFEPVTVLVLVDVDSLQRGMLGWTRNSIVLDGVLLAFKQPGPPSIHAHGMLEAIDVIALDARWTVLGVWHLAPGRGPIAMPDGTMCVLEVFTGAAGTVSPGERMRFGGQ